MGDIGAVQIDRPAVTVGEAEVDKTVEILRKQRTHYQEVEREARTGDSITIDYSGTSRARSSRAAAAPTTTRCWARAGCWPGFEKQVAGLAGRGNRAHLN